MVDMPPDPVTGARRQKRITARTKNEVEVLRAKFIASVSQGGFAEADVKKITVGDYLTQWVASLGQSVRVTTAARYGEILMRHVIPVIGKVQLGKLAPLDIQRLYADRLAAGLSPSTVALLHNILHKALKQGMRWGLLTRNVTEAVDPPKEATPEYVTWNQTQSAAFLSIADRDDLAALWRLALLTGMRRGEVLGLKWEDVDLARGMLAVRRTLSRGVGGGYIFGVPKTAHGRRSIALPKSVVDSLKKHRTAQVELRLKVGEAYDSKLDMVFANALGEPIHPNTLAARFTKLQAQAGVPKIRIHDLRHTSATLMLANGEHPKIVQERLGHSDVSMTLNRYSHVTMDMQKDAAARLDALMEGNR
jgi:integrase